MLTVSLCLALAFSSLGSREVIPDAPNNDTCGHAVSITCNQGNNNTLTGAGDDSFDLPKAAGGDKADSLVDVYYLLDVPAGRWKVKVKVKGLAGAEIEKAQVSMASTNANDPCGGPWDHYKVTAYKGEDRKLNENESIEITQECLLGGKYLIEIACKPAPTTGKGDYRIEVTCDAWQAPAPGNGKAQNAGGGDQSSFPKQADIYLGGNLTPDVFNDVFVIPSQNLSDRQRIPSAVVGSALFVATDGAGHPIYSDLEFAGRSEDDPGIPDSSAPARVWRNARPGSYRIVVDRNGDGFFDLGSDVLTSTFTVQGRRAVPVLSGPFWFGGLVLAVLGAVAYLLRRS